jgi:RNA polymerase sigma-70 factor, ECF subfamily
MEEARESGRLVRRIVARAEDAGEAEAELCRRYAPRAYLYGRRHLRDDERARDLAQSVMLVVIEAVRAGRVEDPERIDRFMLGTCRNVALRMRDVEARAVPTDAAELDAIASVENEPIDIGGLYHCLAELDARDRAVVYLSFTEERSAEEISVVLQTTAGNIRVLRHRAVAQLRRCMDQGHERAAG